MRKIMKHHFSRTVCEHGAQLGVGQVIVDSDLEPKSFKLDG
jgi:hypothetical protein